MHEISVLFAHAQMPLIYVYVDISRECRCFKTSAIIYILTSCIHASKALSSLRTCANATNKRPENVEGFRLQQSSTSILRVYMSSLRTCANASNKRPENVEVFRHQHLSTSILRVYMLRMLWRVSAYAQTRLSLRCSFMR